MASTIVEARGVTKDFGTVQAVRGVDLSIAPGELFGLIGHNGAGKSTLFKMMLGLIPITSGEIRLDGRATNPRADRSDRRIQMVFQNPDSSLNPRHRIGEILGRDKVVAPDDLRGAVDMISGK